MLAKLESCEMATMSIGAVSRISRLRKCEVRIVFFGFLFSVTAVLRLIATWGLMHFFDSVPLFVFFFGPAVAALSFILCEVAICWQAVKILSQSIHATATHGERSDVTPGQGDLLRSHVR